MTEPNIEFFEDGSRKITVPREQVNVGEDKVEITIDEETAHKFSEERFDNAVEQFRERKEEIISKAKAEESEPENLEDCEHCKEKEEDEWP